MADPTAELLVKIGADTKQLKAGLDAADKRVGGFANTIKKHHRAIGMAMAAMGAAILATAALSVKQFAKMGDEVHKMALRTGFSTEALSELRHAAELSGTSLAGVEKASRTLSGAILDAGFGLETYVRAFDKIGLSYEKLKPLSPEEQFIAVLEALADLSDESERAALAADLFGRAGTQLLPMLENGAEGLREMRLETHDLGMVFDQEAALKAAKFNDALTKLKGSVSGVMMEVGSFLVDALKPFVDRVTAIISKLSDWSKEHPGLSRVITYTTIVVGGLLAVLGPLVIIGPKVLAVFVVIRAFLLTKLIPTVWLTVTALWAKVTALLAAMAATGVLIPAAIAAVAAIALLATGITLLVKNQKEQYASTNAVAEATNELAVATETATSAVTSLTREEERLLGVERARLEQAQAMLGVMGRLFPGGFGEAEWEAWRKAGLLTPEAIKGFQAGGIVTRPTIGLISERGPEAIVPLDRGGLGGTVNVYFTEPVFMEREESINKLADRIYRVIKREQRLNFGGAYGG